MGTGLLETERYIFLVGTLWSAVREGKAHGLKAGFLEAGSSVSQVRPGVQMVWSDRVTEVKRIVQNARLCSSEEGVSNFDSIGLRLCLI